MDWDTHGHDIVECIERLFALNGHLPGGHARGELVTASAHALQCAQMAEWAHADDALVAAAFLHDIGHFLVEDATARAGICDDRHELLALPLLAAHFGPDITEPICLHVQAKRFLASIDADYADALSAASRRALALQGGPMPPAEAAAFIAQRHASAALQLRRWDDLAKSPGRTTPPATYYLDLLDKLRQRPLPAARIPIGALDVA